MLSHRILTRQDVARAASYYEDGADDYYANEGEASEWQGKGADALGLSGSVDPERLRELLAGRVTEGRMTSRTSTRQEANSRIGIDLTFSAPKSVSLQALIGGDLTIVRAHDLAVERAIVVAEERAQARKKSHGKSRVEDTRNLVVAKFRHETSREGDPQLHTHALVLNLTRRRDGEWRALHNDQIVKTTRYLGAVYRVELAAELQRAGYALRHGRDGFFELAHIERAQLEAFSRRSARIEAKLAEDGLTRETATTDQAQLAALSTRRRKSSVDRDALYEEWRSRAMALGIDLGRRGTGLRHDGASGSSGSSREPDAEGQEAAEAARRGVRFAVAHLTERQAIIEERDLLDVALKHAMGRAALRHIERETERLTASGYLVRETPLYRAADALTRGEPRPRGAWVSVLTERGVSREEARRRVDEAIQEGRLVPAERRYTTQTALEREKRILQIERDGRGKVVPIASAGEVQRQLPPSGLTSGQRAAAVMIASTSNRVAGVQGYAGTGKSHMLDSAKALAEERGYRVVALAPYASQVRALHELGVEARTLASFLAARKKHLDARTVLVIDEAGTVPTRQMEQALKLAERADARVVLLGDTRQTKAIEAGRPFDQLQEAGMATAQMHQIERQRDERLRRAVELAAKGEAARSLATIGEVREIREDGQRRAAIAREYARMAPEERARTIVVAGTNEARRELNRAIREDLGLAGKGHDVTPSTQVKLLRFLQERTFVPLGSTQERTVDVRVVAATNRDLGEAVASGEFREDFFYRLNVFAIVVPPLRERREDIVPIAERFLSARGLPAEKLSPPARERLLSSPWPGNVRQLENAMERALIVAGEDAILADHLGLDASAARARGPADLLVEGFDLEAFERELILAALARAGGNKTHAARLLGITRRRLYSLLASHGEDAPE